MKLGHRDCLFSPRGMREKALWTGDSDLPDPLLGGHFPAPLSIFRTGSRSEYRIAGRGWRELEKPEPEQLLLWGSSLEALQLSA